MNLPGAVSVPDDGALHRRTDIGGAVRLPSGRHGIDGLSIRPSAPRPRSKKIPNG
jgi:hypothetical protein